MRWDSLKSIVLPTPIADQVANDLVAFVVAILQSGSKIDSFEARVFAGRQTNPGATTSAAELLIADETGKVDRLLTTS